MKLDEKLAEWVGEGLIADDQAAAIQQRESYAQVNKKGPAVPVAVEALGYLGGALFLAATGYLIPDFYDSLSDGQRIAFVAVLTLVAGVGGLLVRTETAPGRRLRSVLWTATTIGAATTTGVASESMFTTEDPGLYLTAGTALVVSGITWTAHRTGLLILAFLAGATAAAVIALTPLDDPSQGATGIMIWGVGVLWVVGSTRRVLDPETPATIGGSLVALIGASMTMEDPHALGGVVLTAVTIGVIGGLGIYRRWIPLLGLSAVGFFFWAQQVASELFDTDAGVAVALASTSVAMILITIYLARRKMT